MDIREAVRVGLVHVAGWVTLRTSNTGERVREVLEDRFGDVIGRMERSGFLVIWDTLDRYNAQASSEERIVGLAQGYYDLGGFTAYAAVECLDSPHPTGSAEYQAFANRLRALSPRIGGSVANELLPCAYWPAAPQSIVGPVTGEGGPPVLVLGNRGDAATPYESSVKIARMLTDGHLVSNDGEGHTSYGRSACVDDAVEGYLVDGTVPQDGLTC